MTATVIGPSTASCAAAPPPPPPLSPRFTKSPSSVRKFPGDIPSSMKSSSSVCSFSTNSTCSHGRRVNFAPLVKVKDTISHRDMSLKEHHAYWLQDHEFLMIRQQNHRLVMQIEEFHNQQKKFGKNNRNIYTTAASTNTQNEAFEPTCRDDCVRGLESSLRSESLRRKSYRFAALEEVLIEQEQQYYGGYYDDNAIAEVYFEVTGECRFRAEYVAVQDRKDIEDYIREDTAALCRQQASSQSSLVSNDDDDDDMMSYE